MKWFAAMMLSWAARDPPPVVVALEPELLADLVCQHLAARGVTAVGAAEAPQRAAVILVDGPLPEGVETEVVVRMPGSGERLPTVVDVERVSTGTSGEVAISDVDALIDLLVDLAGE